MVRDMLILQKTPATTRQTVAPEHKDALPEVNVLPDTINQIDAVICGVKEISCTKVCFSCNSNITRKNGQGNCTRC